MSGAAQRVHHPDERTEPPDTDQPRTPPTSRSASRSAACGTRTCAAARKSGWGDDYPQADYNFMVRLAELTTTTISRWNNGYPGFANVTAMDPDLFRCPYLRMQNAANYDFTRRRDRPHARLPAEGRLSLDRRQLGSGLRVHPSDLMRILPGAQIVDLPVEYPMFSTLYRVDPLPPDPVARLVAAYTVRIPRSGRSTVHYYGVFDDHDRLVVLVSMNSDVSDSWEREGDNQPYFDDLCGEGLCAGCERGRLGHDPLRSNREVGPAAIRAKVVSSGSQQRRSARRGVGPQSVTRRNRGPSAETARSTGRGSLVHSWPRGAAIAETPAR